MRDPSWSLMVCAALGAATLIFSPVGFLSGSAIGLVTLAAGLSYGLRAFGATLLAGLAVGFVQGSFVQFWIAGLEFWLAGFVLAVVLGYTGSLSRALSVAVLGGFVAMAIAYLLMSPSPEVVWSNYIQQVLADLQSNGVYLEPESEVLFKEDIPSVLTMILLMALLLVWAGVLFLARWWQKQLYPTDQSFSEEFRALRLPDAMAVAFAIGFVGLLFAADQLWLSEAVALLSVAFMLQGLAVLHHWVFVRNSGKSWLILVYVMLAMLPHFMMMVAVLGWMENWLNWRSKMDVRH